MNKLQCRICGKVLGYVNDVVDEDQCLCEEHYKKALNTSVDFTIVERPHHIDLDCPFCGENIEIDWEDVPNNYEDWNAIRGETVECPHCQNYVKLGDYDVD
jgi:endogenous inhibitor of DNA gyrase (YacG/DUF329 family)